MGYRTEAEFVLVCHRSREEFVYVGDRTKGAFIPCMLWKKKKNFVTCVKEQRESLYILLHNRETVFFISVMEQRKNLFHVYYRTEEESIPCMLQNSGEFIPSVLQNRGKVYSMCVTEVKFIHVC